MTASTSTPNHPAVETFEQLNLHPDVRKGVEAAGFTDPTPIQARTLPITLKGDNITGQAETGSGKTAAFLLGAFNTLLRRPPRDADQRGHGDPRALIIAPTRELVVQIADDAKLLGEFTGLRVHAVYGGVDYDKQRDAFQQQVDVLVGTPGRLIDYHKQRVYNLKHLEVLIIDECDRLFDMGFIDDTRWLMRRMPKPAQRQNMLFSATINFDVQEFAWEWMSDPPVISVDPDQAPPDRIDQLVYHVARREKLRLLFGLLRQHILVDDEARVLIFANTRHMVQKVADTLRANDISTATLSGSVPQHRRMKALEQFRSGHTRVVVATDVAARGIHIDDVTHVINIDVPQTPEDYVHRVGRTARAGATGKAITLASEDTVENLPKIEAHLDLKIPVDFPDEPLLASYKSPPPQKRSGRGPGGGRGKPNNHGKRRGRRPRSRR